MCVCAHRERERGNDQKAAALVHDKGKRPTETQRDIAAHSGGAREPDVGEFNTLEPYSLNPPPPPTIPKLNSHINVPVRWPISWGGGLNVVIYVHL